MHAKAHTVDTLVIALAAVATVASIALFAWDARPTFVPLAWPPAAALAWNAGLSLLFFVQHSGMVRRGYRARASGLIPPRYYGALYAIVSGLTLLLVFVLWQRVDIPVFRLDGPARWAAQAVSAAVAVLMLYAGYLVRRTIDFLGVRPIRAHQRGEVPQAMPFFVEGPFRWVRHPLYACILALMWIRPEMMADGLLLSVLWSAWIVAGTVLEERDLVADFGDAYRGYQRSVPMLIPWRRAGGHVGVAALCALTFAACSASFQGHKLPVVRSLQPPAANAQKPSVSIALHVSAEKKGWPANEFMQGELDMLHQLLDAFEKSGQFSRVSAGGQGDLDVAIDVLVVRKGSAALAVLCIATFFIVPTSATDEYHVKATVAPAGGTSRTYALANTVTTHGGWLMLPVSVFADPMQVTERTRQNIWNTLILRMQQDGLLAGR